MSRLFTSPLRPRSAAVVATLPVVTAGLLAAQAEVARSREYLPRDPGYRVSGWVAGDGDGPPARLAVLGDSTVAGVGSPTVEQALPVLVAERVAGALGRPVHVDALGVAGAVTAAVVDAQLPQAAALRPDVVVAVVGSNDVTHVTPPWRLRADVAALADGVRARLGAPLVLAGIPLFQGATAIPRPLRDVVVGYARLLRDTQRRAAARAGIGYVEIARDASPRFAGVPEAMSGDGFHPAPVGYGFWADAIAPVVAASVHRRRSAEAVRSGRGGGRAPRRPPAAR